MLRKNNSRTTNTIYNFTSSIGGQILTIAMQFFVRTVFISTLGKAYLGINGLFSNILSMLSLAELGFGSAILYKLYKPIAEEDHNRIALLMKFYKTVYRVIGVVITVVGLCLIPFLPRLINDYDRLTTLNINAAFIFLLYLLQSVTSYLFFAYKSAIVRADQKEYLLNLVSYLFTVGASIVQIVCLIFFSNFQLYVGILVLQTVGQNLACAVIADKLYPYINKKTKEKIGKEEVIGVFKDCAALFLYTINSVVVKATDNIVISMFLGLDHVALYSNYYIFYTTIRTLYVKIFNSVSHSLGNLHTTQNKKHEYNVFETVMLIGAILGGTAFVGITVVADELIGVWIGSDWTLAMPFSVLLGLELYTAAYKLILSKYRTTMGLFQQAKFRPVAGMIINITVSVVLVNYLGIIGVLVGTIVSDWLTFMWFDPLIIHKYGFGNSFPVSVYYRKFILNFLIICICGILDWIICSKVFVGFGWGSVFIHACICGITVPGVMVLTSLHSDEGKYIWSLIKREVNTIFKRIRRK